MERPLISVIIPVFNVEKYLDRCLLSVVLQTYNNLEIILVDDGSTDSCPNMCDEWAKKDSRIKVIHKENGGLSDARNVGMTIANGEYIGFVDSDDWIAPEMYGRLVDAMNQDQSEIAACTVKMVWEDNRSEKLLTVKENRILDREDAQLALLNESFLKQPVWYKLYKRNLTKDIPFEVGKQHEDVFWSYQVIGRANRVSLIEYEGYYYWQRKGSIMNQDYSLRRMDVMEAYILRHQYICENFPNLKQKSMVSLWFECRYHGQMALRYLKDEEIKYVLDYLTRTLSDYPLSRNDILKQKRIEQIWLMIERISLKGVCQIRNILNIGF